ncbi:sulfatase-like hydrolase/transferase [Prosthecobacter sp.]|uniref:sulfatase-like hydrolase/transferase n=1 Tax=Prosthecobacter sp. TaxID=1965333 RepID=UPI00248A56F5|nr:sulfatase-like hydrolase/transferase [Prosthecobacter sp.]MDI1315635.1 sulfatase-like hydrolase/transferase [Prosthecobacter sp.]
MNKNLSTILLGLLAYAVNLAAAERPNILVILCDDLGYADVGFNGAKDITTPHLDTLAKNGTIFTSAYVCHPFCGPSRMGFVSGRYPHNYGGQYNLPNGGKGMAQYNKEGIPVSETLISTVLQDAGYHTGLLGKWHMGLEPQFHPNARGFDDFYGFLGGGHMYFPEKYVPIYERQSKSGKGEINEYVVPLQRNGTEVKETEYLTDALSREASRFVTESAATKKPFFLYLAYNAPHTPLEAKAEDLAKFASIQDPKRRTYAAMVYAVDRGVGQIVKTLKSTGTLDNTLIVFFSDNGGQLGDGANNAPLKGGKGDCFEGGYRVPMFFHWPKVVPAGQKFEHPVSSLDFYPTFTQLAGASIPSGKQLDGKDIWADFLAQRSPHQGQMIYALRHRDGFNNVGARQDQWKLSLSGRNGQWALFDLNADIAEEHDVSGQHAQRVKDMVSKTEQWSRTCVEPKWFDSQQAAEKWKETGMPHYDETFRLK